MGAHKAGGIGKRKEGDDGAGRKVEKEGRRRRKLENKIKAGGRDMGDECGGSGRQCKRRGSMD